MRLSKAKTNLILDHPFFGALAMNMPFELTDRVPTAATNGKVVYFNPEFITPLSDNQITFLVAHEVMHPMFDHNGRKGSRDHKKWNVAADFVINQLLMDEKIGEFIEGGCLNKGIYDAGRGMAEGIYDILPDQGEGQNGNGGTSNGGSAYDDIEDSGQTEEERHQQAEEWKVKVAQAAQSAKMMGKLSANMERLVSKVVASTVRWQDVLRNFIVKAKTDDRTWARPNRRFINQGMYLPSVTGEAIGELVIAVDCSGSVGQADMDRFAAECTAIKDDLNPSVMHIVYFDSEVCHYDRFASDDELTLKLHGGGGTAFSPVFKYIDENNIDPVACVFLTDLYCSDFGKQPAYPVLWVSYGDDKAPFGEVVKM
jgi:predicted metal-dependent peptidase